MPKLCVNIDHIATLRQARLNFFSLEKAIGLIKKAGAAGVTVHLREDRRHIQDWDLPVVRKVTKELGLSFTLELAAIEEMVSIGKLSEPDLVTLVPEKREELTTEGGLLLLGEKQKTKYKKITNQFREKNIPVSLFIEPKPDVVKVASEIAEVVELHTGKFSEIFKADPRAKNLELELENLKSAANLAKELNLKVNAGHGIDAVNLPRIMEIKGLSELHVGYSIIYEAVFVGLENSVKDFLRILKKSS